VVKGGSAVGEDTSGVVRPVGSINSDGDGLFLESSQKSRSGFRNIGVTSEGVLGSGDLRLLARVLSSSVGISRVSNNICVLDVLEGFVHKTTIASRVSGGAVNELLFREVNALSGSTVDDESRLKSTSGGESPAWTARSLVLNSGNVSSGSPVNGGSVNGKIVNGLSGSGSLKSKVGGLEFNWGEVEELGDSVSSGGVFSNNLEVHGENFHSVVIDSGVSVFLSVGLLEGLPFLLKRRISEVVALLGSNEVGGGTEEENSGESEEESFVHLWEYFY